MKTVTTEKSLEGLISCLMPGTNGIASGLAVVVAVTAPAKVIEA